MFLFTRIKKFPSTKGGSFTNIMLNNLDANGKQFSFLTTDTYYLI